MNINSKITSFHRSLGGTLALLTTAALLSACGSGGVVTGAQLKSFQQSGDQFAEINVTLNTAAMVLPAVEIPILSSPGVQIGSVSIQPGIAGGQSALLIDADLSKLLHLPSETTNPTLPNGTALPIAGVDVSTVLSFPIGSGGSKAYFSIKPDLSSAMFGTALVISQFSVGVTANLLLPFGFTGVSGVAGVFTGVTAGQSGFALFADVTSVLAGQMTLASSDGTTSNHLSQLSTLADVNGLTSSRSPISKLNLSANSPLNSNANSTPNSNANSNANSTPNSTSSLKILPQQPSTKVTQQIHWMLYRLNSAQKQLTIP